MFHYKKCRSIEVYKYLYISRKVFLIIRNSRLFMARYKYAGPSRGRAGPGAIFWSGARMFKGAARRRNPWASGLMRFGLIY